MAAWTVWLNATVPPGLPVGRYRGGVGNWTSILVDARHAVYVGTRRGLVAGVCRTGRLFWQIETGATVDSYPALTDDRALV